MFPHREATNRAANENRSPHHYRFFFVRTTLYRFRLKYLLYSPCLPRFRAAFFFAPVEPFIGGWLVASPSLAGGVAGDADVGVAAVADGGDDGEGGVVLVELVVAVAPAVAVPAAGGSAAAGVVPAAIAVAGARVAADAAAETAAAAGLDPAFAQSSPAPVTRGGSEAHSSRRANHSGVGGVKQRFFAYHDIFSMNRNDVERPASPTNVGTQSEKPLHGAS